MQKKVKLTEAQKKTSKELLIRIEQVKANNEKNLAEATLSVNLYAQAILEGKNLDAGKYVFDENLDLIFIKDEKDLQEKIEKKQATI